MEFIFDYPDQVKVLYMCGYSFDEAVEIANKNDDQTYDLKARCIELYFGRFEHSTFSLVPNYMDLVVTEQEVKEDVLKDWRDLFTRKFKKTLEESPLQGVALPQDMNKPDIMPPVEENTRKSFESADQGDDDELPF